MTGVEFGHRAPLAIGGHFWLVRGLKLIDSLADVDDQMAGFVRLLCFRFPMPREPT